MPIRHPPGDAANSLRRRLDDASVSSSLRRAGRGGTASRASRGHKSPKSAPQPLTSTAAADHSWHEGPKISGEVMTPRLKFADQLAFVVLLLAAVAAAAGLLVSGLYRDTEEGIRQARATDLVTL